MHTHGFASNVFLFFSQSSGGAFTVLLWGGVSRRPLCCRILASPTERTPPSGTRLFFNLTTASVFPTVSVPCIVDVFHPPDPFPSFPIAICCVSLSFLASSLHLRSCSLPLSLLFLLVSAQQHRFRRHESPEQFAPPPPTTFLLTPVFQCLCGS